MFGLFWLRSAGFAFDDLAPLALPSAADAGLSDAAFQEHMTRARAEVAGLLARPRTAEALLLSNLDSLDRLSGLHEVLQRPLNSRARQRLRLAWSYLQRFHTKNDTCSFFGPLACGQVDPEAHEALRLSPVRPGGAMLSRRRVMFEHWVIDRMHAVVREELRSVTAARLHAGCDIDADAVCLPGGRRVPVPAEVLTLLRRAADEAGLDVAALDGAGGTAAALASRFLVHELALPPGSPDALDVLATAALAAGPASRAAALPEAIRTLAAQRDEFERADAGRRRHLLDRMSGVLTGAGVAVSRTKGTMYAGRLPVYEDCERNLVPTLSGAFAGTLTDRLLPVLRLYRVLAQCAAARLHAAYADTLARTRADPGAETDFVAFLRQVRGAGQPPVHEAVAAELRGQLHDIWHELALGAPADELHVTAAGLGQIAGALRAATPEQHRFAGVLGAGIVSPDLLIAAPDVAAINAGDARIIIGDVHPGVLTALQPVVMPFLGAEATRQARAEANRLLAPGRILLASSGRTYHRSQIDWPVVPNLWEIVLPGSASRVPRERQIPAGRGRIVRRSGLLHFRDRRTGREDDLVTVLSTDLHRVLFTLAGALLGGSLPQRILWQQVVMKRRSWCFGKDAVPAVARPAETLEQYRSLAQWAGAAGLPRHCFFLAAGEPKPMYLDWRNPLAVDVFAKMAKQATSIVVTEMSPRPDELWLRDDGGRYCAELRTSFVL